MNDIVTSVQYSGFLQSDIRRMYKASPETEAERVKKILEEQRKIVQPVYGAKKKIIEEYEPGRFVNILI